MAVAGAMGTATLDRACVGVPLRVVAVGEAHRARLADEGLSPGSELTVETVAPFGGPLVVRLDRARLALARTVAATVEVAARQAEERP